MGVVIGFINVSRGDEGVVRARVFVRGDEGKKWRMAKRKRRDG